MMSANAEERGASDEDRYVGGSDEAAKFDRRRGLLLVIVGIATPTALLVAFLAWGWPLLAAATPSMILGLSLLVFAGPFAGAVGLYLLDALQPNPHEEESEDERTSHKVAPRGRGPYGGIDVDLTDSHDDEDSAHDNKSRIDSRALSTSHVTPTSHVGIETAAEISPDSQQPDSSRAYHPLAQQYLSGPTIKYG